MSSEKVAKPKQGKTLIKMLFLIAVVGWIGFFLIFFHFKGRNDALISKAQKYDSELNVQKTTSLKSNQKQKEVISKIVAQRDKKQTLLTNESQIRQDLELKIKNIEEETQKLTQSFSQLESTSKKQKSNAKKARVKITKQHHTLLDEVISKFINKDASDALVIDVASIVKNNPSSSAKEMNRIHSQLADEFFSRSLFEHAKEHIKLSNNFNPKQSQQLSNSLDLNIAFESVEKAIAEKQEEAEVKKKIEHARKLVDQLKTDPKKTEIHQQLSLKIFKLETDLLLTKQPKKALDDLAKLLESEKEVSLQKDSSITQRIHYLELALVGYQLSNTLSNEEQKIKFEASIETASTSVKEKIKDHPLAYYTSGVVLLNKLDTLFTNGDPKKIEAAATEIETVAKLSGKQNSEIFKAAIAGHRAAVLFEKGQITNGKKTLTSGIERLKLLQLKDPKNSFAHYRLGILYWLEAQLTTSKDVSFSSLKKSETALESAQKFDNGVLTGSIYQFAAMVEGDLGHIAYSNKKPADAKVHFTKALAHWQKIESSWGKSPETKEGIEYCKWRISSL